MQAYTRTVYPGQWRSCGRTHVELRPNSTYPETAPFQPFRREVKRHHDMRFAPQGSRRIRAFKQRQTVNCDPPNPAQPGFFIGRSTRRPMQMLKDYRCGQCKKLLARMGEYTELQIKCSRCGTLNHVKAASREPRVIAVERQRYSSVVAASRC
ncbi:hypothetical protein ALP60_01020 [Pseudomonas savastanoi]|uniref:Com family DNA-binding transcriptional regulator n=1 Tax=Pseudomonas savastanoi TaxID=29438 RepID=A0A3M5F437_PSESS|nr:hypothetical protein ALP60_01020 [Pseudomonas savastanoi]